MLPEEFKRNPVSDCCIGHLPDLPNHHHNMNLVPHASSYLEEGCHWLGQSTPRVDCA